MGRRQDDLSGHVDDIVGLVCGLLDAVAVALGFVIGELSKRRGDYYLSLLSRVPLLLFLPLSTATAARCSWDWLAYVGPILLLV